jgi:hypothetical protein
VLGESLAGRQGEYEAFHRYFLAMYQSKLGADAKAKDSFDWAEQLFKQQTDLPAKEIAELKELQKQAKDVLKYETGPRPRSGSNTR